MSRQDAEKNGILSANGALASLNIASIWQDSPTKNVLLRIPGQNSGTNSGAKTGSDTVKDKVAKLAKKQKIILLSACLDTFGSVPDVCPGKRRAANVALLMEVMHDLQKNKPNCDVVAVLWGSHYSAEEGARFLYFGITNAADQNFDLTKSLHSSYVNEYEQQQKLSTILQENNIFRQSSAPLLSKAVRRLRSELNIMTNNLNYQISRDITKNVYMQSKEINQRINKNKIYRGKCQELKGVLSNPDQENLQRLDSELKEPYENLLQVTRRDTIDHIKQLHNLRLANESTQEIENLFINKNIVCHLEFDFANDDSAWLLNTNGDYTLNKEKPSTFDGLMGFQSHIKSLSNIFHTSNPQLNIQASSYNGLISSHLKLYITPESLSAPGPRSLSCAIGNSFGVYAYNMNNIGTAYDDDEMPQQKKVSLLKLKKQLSAFIHALSYSRDVSSKHRYRSEKQDKNMHHRIKVHNQVKSSNEIEGVAKGAIVYMGRGDNKGTPYRVGWSRYAISRTANDGTFFIPMLREARYTMQAHTFNEFGVATRFNSNRGNLNNINLFYGFGGGFYTPYTPGNYDYVLETTGYRGKQNSRFTTVSSDASIHTTAIYTDRTQKLKVKNVAGMLLLGT
ncbi:MAG: hypothetical protein HRU15_12200, partial [Planctomycetes bacterium]|nr:hypothetical protein [Planctomycetota bacterium]